RARFMISGSLLGCPAGTCRTTQIAAGKSSGSSSTSVFSADTPPAEAPITTTRWSGMVTCRDMHRQRAGEGRAMAAPFALRGHRPVVSQDDVLHDREAEAQTAVDAGGTVRLTEALEELRHEFRRNPDAGVMDGDAP